MNIFRDFVEANFDYSIIDVLDTYESLFDRLGIDISDNDLVRNPWDGEDFQQNLKIILMESAQQEGIIPRHWDLNVHCDEDDAFTLINFEDDEMNEVYRVKEEFENWTNGLTLQVI